MLNIKSAVVTGATGMIASNLIQLLIEKNIRVLALVRRSSKKEDNIPKSPLVTVMHKNLDEYKQIKTEKKYDAFFHFAWNGTYGSSRDDIDLQMTNVLYSMDCVNLAKKLGCKVFVGAGSQAEYGVVPSGHKLKPDTPLHPITNYGIAKCTAGKMTNYLCNRHGIRHVWARILSVYGIGDNPYTMVSSTVRKLINKEKPSFTKGEQLWDFLFSRDAAKAFYLMAELGKNNSVYPLGSGKCKPLKEYIEEIKNAVDGTIVLDYGGIEYSKNQVMYLCADISDLKRDTDFEPEYDFKSGIKLTVGSVLNEKNRNSCSYI